MKDNKEHYQPGLCNIGIPEIGIRKKLFTFFLLVTLLLTCLSFSLYKHPWMMFLFFGSTFFTILLFIEIRLRFCILFGFFNLHNFSHPGNLENVDNPHHGQKDKIKAIKIISLTVLAAALATGIDYWLASYLYS